MKGADTENGMYIVMTGFSDGPVDLTVTYVMIDCCTSIAFSREKPGELIGFEGKLNRENNAR